MARIAKDRFSALNGGVNVSALSAFLITPSDVDELPYVTRRVLIDGADGVIKAQFFRGEIEIIPVRAGNEYDWRIKKVFSTGTTAGLTIVGFD